MRISPVRHGRRTQSILGWIPRVKTRLGSGLAVFAMITLLPSCFLFGDPAGNAELEAGNVGVRMSIVAGNNQATAPNNIHKAPLIVRVSDPNTDSPAAAMTVDWSIESVSLEIASDTKAAPPLALIASSDSSDEGFAATQIKAPSKYGQAYKVRATLRGTETSVTFDLSTQTTGLGTQLAATTTGAGIEVAGKAFGFIIKILDDQGNIVTEANETKTLIWAADNSNKNKSWTGKASVLPPSTMACQFVQGVCTTTHLLYCRRASHHAVLGGDGPGDQTLRDVFAAEVSIKAGDKSELVLADKAGGQKQALCLHVYFKYSTDRRQRFTLPPPSMPQAITLRMQSCHLDHQL